MKTKSGILPAALLGLAWLLSTGCVAQQVTADGKPAATGAAQPARGGVPAAPLDIKPTDPDATWSLVRE